MKIAIIVSEFNANVTDRLLEGAVQRLNQLNIPELSWQITSVPGAVEIPLIARQFAKSGKFNAIICLGAVIRGETDHYDYVCQQVSYGCQKVALKFDVPVIFGILTTENEAQALARSGGDEGNKGKDAVDASIEMITLMDTLKDL
jgi:6,7-dimethyl-8-ribityllumazine synthase